MPVSEEINRSELSLASLSCQPAEKGVALNIASSIKHGELNVYYWPRDNYFFLFDIWLTCQATIDRAQLTVMRWGTAGRVTVGNVMHCGFATADEEGTLGAGVGDKAEELLSVAGLAEEDEDVKGGEDADVTVEASTGERKAKQRLRRVAMSTDSVAVLGLVGGKSMENETEDTGTVRGKRYGRRDRGEAVGEVEE
ncbi:hypothetical protein CRG98_019814 [Punica granatum]|uniref:Uncharacterized protein n=1 Tax=Punica granatum TaxID=22663 RepID=A0A2I0JU28_PUNGR|nr:hypothetical protein CRG98_019814 [Punica granatum]